MSTKLVKATTCAVAYYVPNFLAIRLRGAALPREDWYLARDDKVFLKAPHPEAESLEFVVSAD